MFSTLEFAGAARARALYLLERERQLLAAHRAVGHAAGSGVFLQLQSLLQRRPGGRRTLRTVLPLLAEIDLGCLICERHLASIV